MLFTAEHEEPRRTLQKFIAAEINPHVDEWEAAGQFPAHDVVQEARRSRLPRTEQAGRVRRRGPRLFLRIDDGGGTRRRAQRLGADGDRRPHRHGDARARPLWLGRIAPRVPRARDFGRRGRVRRRVRAGRRLRRRRDQNKRAIGRRRLRHRWRQDVDHQWRASRLDVPARQHRRRPQASQQVADLRADESEGRDGRAQARQARHARLRHGADFLRGGAGSEDATASATRARALSTR